MHDGDAVHDGRAGVSALLTRTPPPSPERPPAAGIRPPWSARRVAAWLFPLAFCGAGLFAVSYVGVDPILLWQGLADVGALLVRAWPPEIADPAGLASAVLETVAMTVAGTALAAVIAAVLGVLAARNTAPGRVARSVALTLIVSCRAVPDVVFAVFFVAVLGIGPLAGVLALGLHSVGMLGKLFAEAVERADEGVRDAVAATGAGPLQRIFSGVLPQVVPAGIAAVLYRLDINFRTSVLLGAVGAGGVGLELKTAFGFTDYQGATGIGLVIVAVVLLIEAASAGLRALLIAPGAARRADTPPVRGLRVPWTRSRLVTHLAAWGALALVVFSLWRAGVTPQAVARLVTGSASAIADFWPPAFAPLADVLLPGLAETAAIAMAATFLGVLAGVPLGLLSARGVPPHPAVHVVARTGLVGLRAIPDLLFVLVFITAFGLADGAVAGAFALAVFTAALVGKLIADAAEEVRYGPREAVRSAGARRTQELSTSVIGPIVPSVAGTALYALDINLRNFFILGIVGAGELGFALSQNLKALNYDQVTAIVLPIFGIVLLVELLSSLVRGTLR